MEIVLALTIAAKLADLAIEALNGVQAAADTYNRVRPLIDAIRREGRDPTADEWRVLNSMLDNAFDRLMAD